MGAIIMIELRNSTDHTFTDISSEEWRKYTFPDGEVVFIANPAWLNVNPKSGGHRLLDQQGESHYVPANWLCLTWKALDGQPHFVK